MPNTKHVNWFNIVFLQVAWDASDELLSWANMAVESKQPGDPGRDYSPHVAPQTVMREASLRAIILGAVLGVVFGASSLYLVLKVGLTVSASIPVAVISLTLFRLWAKVGGRDATILENNIVQTAGVGRGVHRVRLGCDHAGHLDSWV